jgi:hypothetical protein
LIISNDFNSTIFENTNTWIRRSKINTDHGTNIYLKSGNQVYWVCNGNLPFLSSSAAKENVKAVVAMRRKIANIFMFIERRIC